MPKKYLKVGIVTDDEAMQLYPCIVLWGRELQSFDYYIIDQCHLALAEHAPVDATYRDSVDCRWHTVRDIGNDAMRARYAAHLKANRPLTLEHLRSAVESNSKTEKDS